MGTYGGRFVSYVKGCDFGLYAELEVAWATRRGNCRQMPGPTSLCHGRDPHAWLSSMVASSYRPPLSKSWHDIRFGLVLQETLLEGRLGGRFCWLRVFLQCIKKIVRKEGLPIAGAVILAKGISPEMVHRSQDSSDF